MERANLRSRRPLAVAIAVLLASALGVGVVRAQRAPGSGRLVATVAPAGSARSSTTGPPADPPTTAAAPTTVAAATAAPAPTVAVPVTAARPATRPAAPAAAVARPASNPVPPAGAGLGPHPAGSVILPYQSGQHSWSAVSNGITLSLDMVPVAPRAGEPVTFTATATAPSRVLCCSIQVYPMDMSGMSWQPISTDGRVCNNLTLPPTVQHVVTRTFNKGGRLDFFMQAASLCDAQNIPGTTAVMYGYLDVGPGPSTSQGPSLPVLTADDGRLPAQMHDPTLAAIFAQAQDADGFIAGFSINWGDGTPVANYIGDPLGCIQTPEGWPQRSMGWAGGTRDHTPPTHRYAVPQPVMITVTVTSTGCDGSDPQQAGASVPWVPPTP